MYRNETGAFEQALSMMPYVMMIGVGFGLIATLIYAVYDYLKRKDKKNLFLHFVYAKNIIFVGFTAFALWTVMQLEPGESLGAEQEIMLLIAIIGFILFDAGAYFISAGIKNTNK